MAWDEYAGAEMSVIFHVPNWPVRLSGASCGIGGSRFGGWRPVGAAANELLAGQRRERIRAESRFVGFDEVVDAVRGRTLVPASGGPDSCQGQLLLLFSFRGLNVRRLSRIFRRELRNDLRGASACGN